MIEGEPTGATSVSQDEARDLIPGHIQPPIEWKSRDLDNDGQARLEYISALRCADDGDYSKLIDLFLAGRE